FLAKFDPNGLLISARKYGDAQSQSIRGVAVGPNDDIAVTGVFSSAIDFGGGPLQSMGGDVFVAILDPMLGQIFSKAYGDNFGQIGEAIAFNATGIAVTGLLRGTIDFGSGPLVSSPSGGDIFVAGLSTSGNGLFSARFGDDNNDQAGNCVAFDHD